MRVLGYPDLSGKGIKYSRQHIHRLVRKGLFPPPFKMSGGDTGPNNTGRPVDPVVPAPGYDMTAQRQRLPNRRLCETFRFEHGGMKYTASIARFADDRLAEIFISNHKTGSDTDAAAKDSVPRSRCNTACSWRSFATPSFVTRAVLPVHRSALPSTWLAVRS
jgi:hypothetical protein